MDFGEILQRWERHSPWESSPQAKVATAVSSLPSRREMELRSADAVLDLHGFTQREAEVVLRRFLSESQHQGLQKVLVIHGKGIHSERGGVLGPLVERIFAGHRAVARWGQARRDQGGNGARWAWLSVLGR